MFVDCLHLLSNGVIKKNAFRDLHILFEGLKSKIFISLKQKKLAQKCERHICRFTYLPSNGVIEKVEKHDLDLLSEGKQK